MRFFSGFRVLFVAAALPLALQGCAWDKKESDLKDGPLKVQIPYAIDGNYQLDVVELFTLKDVTHLKGLAARFLIDPQTKQGRLNGRLPEIRYIRDRDGVIVAKDNLSLQLLTIYAHIEKLKALDEKLGAGGVLTYPRVVAVNARMQTQDGRVETDNAVYSGQYDALMVEPFSLSTLPLAVNGGVLGHEHFHALFQKLVIEPLGKKYPDPDHPTGHDEQKMAQRLLGDESFERSRTDSSPATASASASAADQRTLYHATLMRGINEGLADFWGWIYSGDVLFVGRSLPTFKALRKLDVVPMGSFTDKREVYDSITHGASSGYLVDHYSYSMGTQLARALRNLTSMYADEKKISSEEARNHMATVLLSALPELKKRFEALKDDEDFSLGLAAAAVVSKMDDLQESHCDFILNLMSSGDAGKSGLQDRCAEVRKNAEKKSAGRSESASTENYSNANERSERVKP